VQAIPVENGWEIGYHIAKKYTGNGYATEAVESFLPIIMKRLNINKISGLSALENIASCRVMEKCGFVLEYRGIGDYKGNTRKICRYSYSYEKSVQEAAEGKIISFTMDELEAMENMSAEEAQS